MLSPEIQELGKSFRGLFFLLNKTAQMRYLTEPICLKYLAQLLVISRQQTEMFSCLSTKSIITTVNFFNMHIKALWIISQK